MSDEQPMDMKVTKALTGIPVIDELRDLLSCMEDELHEFRTALDANDALEALASMQEVRGYVGDMLLELERRPRQPNPDTIDADYEDDAPVVPFDEASRKHDPSI